LGVIFDEAMIKVAEAEEGLEFLMVLGWGHLVMPETLAGSMPRSSEMTTPRYSMED